MEWLTAALGGVLSGLAQGVLALFGMSDAQRLGRVQIQNQDLTAELKTEKDALDVENKVADMSPAAVDAELRSTWK